MITTTLDPIYIVGLIIIIAVILAAGTILFINAYKKKELPALVMTAVVAAEKWLGSGTGKYKFNYAVTYVYERLPKSVKSFLSLEQLTQLIEDAVKVLSKSINEDGIDIADYDTKSKDI